jgi:hypothetical protein
LICLAMLAAEDVQEVVAAVVVVMVSGLGYCDLIRFCGEKTMDDGQTSRRSKTIITYYTARFLGDATYKPVPSSLRFCFHHEQITDGRWMWFDQRVVAETRTSQTSHSAMDRYIKLFPSPLQECNAS